MRLLRYTVFAVLLAACSAGASSSVTRVDGPQAQQLVSKGALLLDVRTPQEYSRGHIENARNIPVDVLEGRLGDLDKNQPVVVYCQSGKRSARAASMLKAAGFTQVSDLGGMSNW